MRRDPDLLRQLAQRADQISAEGSYVNAQGQAVKLPMAACLDGCRLVSPDQWASILALTPSDCGRPTQFLVTAESTLAALYRMVVSEGKRRVCCLNFASARNAGGGYRNGALAQEETLARASGLVPTLERHGTYYAVNRAESSLLYTDHAIWSPAVPFFADDDGNLLNEAYVADIITMPAPNLGAMRTESDILAVPDTFRRRIAMVLALAAQEGVDHLVLGAWGCGAFANHPDLVARWFAEELAKPRWARVFISIDFAIYETSKRRPCLPSFVRALGDAGLVCDGGTR